MNDCMITNKMIQDYFNEKYSMKVSSNWIARIKVSVP